MQTRIEKRKRLIKRLYKEIGKETVGTNLSQVKLVILLNSTRGASYCRTKYNIFKGPRCIIGLNLRGMLDQVKDGYRSDYYATRPDRLNKYIINNRHNALRFLLYHELRHAYQKFAKLEFASRGEREYDADTWAIAHLNIRKPNQTKKPDPIKTNKPHISDYIELYNKGYSTSKIAYMLKIKDPRSVRYYLTKAGINLRRK